ncbi:SidA/IucD/PvdA family monooxygenase [Streptomyces sp. CL12]|uniref:SidA/IucD/PvdA family monooxygenase n=1 Tax=Streptomyces sp. CL12 TaxID=3391744 RepID=UPI003A8020DA
MHSSPSEQSMAHHHHHGLPLLVIGAGPKSLALAAKAAVLRAVGCDAPEVVVVERDRVGANWREGSGWTNGRQALGTRPEKDLGFPYRGDSWGAGIGPRVSRQMTRFSWTTYLVHQGTYADWVDRGQPHPNHREWADYLDWAAGQASARVIAGEVRGIETDGQAWDLTLAAESGERRLRGCGLVVSGPGPCKGVIPIDGLNAFDAAGFWRRATSVGFGRATSAVVIGAGETAGSVVRELIRTTECAVTVVTPRATLYSRGESHFENRYYSDPSGWTSLSQADRVEFIRRTDRAVFSQAIQGELARTSRVTWQPGRVTSARVGGGVELTVEYDGNCTDLAADLVVDATGGDPLWFTGLLGQEARTALEAAIGGSVSRQRIDRAIGSDLAPIGLEPKLHMPNLAGLAQGPGFPNLSCLGLLSDRILASYTRPGRHHPNGKSVGAPPIRHDLTRPNRPPARPGPTPEARPSEFTQITEGVAHR